MAHEKALRSVLSTIKMDLTEYMKTLHLRVSCQFSLSHSKPEKGDLLIVFSRYRSPILCCL